MLSLENLSCGYEGSLAVGGIDLKVDQGEVVALIGPNGAGKTSTVQCIAGHVKISAGRISIDGDDIVGSTPQQRIARGIAVAPEGRRLFSDMTVRENLIVGGLCQPKASTGANMQKVVALFPQLEDRMQSLCRTLSGGEQQMVAIGRALMAEPKLLMIDEVSLGLMPKNVDICYRAIDALKKRGIAILLVEQVLSRALDAADRIYLMEAGRIVWSGSSAVARGQRGILERFFGQSGHMTNTH